MRLIGFWVLLHLVIVMQKRAKVSREMTFQEDSDWEPMQQTKPVESVKWFCVNCTMPNPGDMVHCYVRFNV